MKIYYHLFNNALFTLVTKKTQSIDLKNYVLLQFHSLSRRVCSLYPRNADYGVDNTINLCKDNPESGCVAAALSSARDMTEKLKPFEDLSSVASFITTTQVTR